MEWDILFDQGEATFSRWKVNVGEFVPAGGPLFEFTSTQGKQLFKASKSGVIVKREVSFKSGTALTSKSMMVQMKGCEHVVVMKGMCADCGADLRQTDDSTVSAAKVPMIHAIPELHVTQEEAKKQGTEDENYLIRHEKLVLLVDLDQTLIHTTNEHVDPNIKGIEHFTLGVPHPRRAQPEYHTRLRPHTREFLSNLSQLYQLHICTFGIRMYAHTVARILDPTGSLFGQRILSRDECFDANTKSHNLKALFPNGDHMVCIIDDREDVWNYARNIVHVKPYRYFKHTGDINAPPGFSKSDEDEEEEDEEKDDPASDPEKEDDIDKGNGDASEKMPGEETAEKQTRRDTEDGNYLLDLEKILRRIHSAFYQIYKQKGEADMKTIVPYVKSKVLKDCRLVFTGVIPNNHREDLSPIYRAAMTFGAEVQKQIITAEMAAKDPTLKPTTHVVAAKRDTGKYHEAKKAGIAVVSPQWVWNSVERWERGDEELFPVSLEAVPPSVAATGGFHYLHLSANEFMPPDQQQQQEGEGEAPSDPAPARVAERHLADFPSFSHDLMDRMSHEVDDALSDEDDDDGNDEEEGDEEDSLSGSKPKGWKKRAVPNPEDDGSPSAKHCRPGREGESSSNEVSNQGTDESGDSLGSIDDEMAAALEKEFAEK